MVQLLNTLMASSGGGMPVPAGPPGMPSRGMIGRQKSATFVADTRTNSVLVYAAEKDVEPIAKLIKELDVPPDVLARVEHHYYDAGHMMYTREADLKKLKGDLAVWLRG